MANWHDLADSHLPPKHEDVLVVMKNKRLAVAFWAPEDAAWYANPNGDLVLIHDVEGWMPLSTVLHAWYARNGSYASQCSAGTCGTSES